MRDGDKGFGMDALPAALIAEILPALGKLTGKSSNLLACSLRDAFDRFGDFPPAVI